MLQLYIFCFWNGNVAFKIMWNRVYICMKFVELCAFINGYQNLYDSPNLRHIILHRKQEYSFDNGLACPAHPILFILHYKFMVSLLVPGDFL